jgi:NTP pyrophosphatase (non-canonical NTP hydrolase)
MNSKNINNLSPAETERLALLAEECGEVIQVVGKILRHGYASANPLIEDSPTNREELEKELGDLLLIMSFLETYQDINPDNVELRMVKKATKITKWLHYQEPIED